MKNWKTLLPRLGSAMMSLTLAALLLSGCGLFDAPTASNESETASAPELWNPEPGDEIESGREVPVLNDTYWEDLYGPTINPFLIRDDGRLGGIDGITTTSRTIPGDVGGEVTLGNHYYIVPAGAVDGTVRFTMAYASVTGVGVDCGPSPMSFDSPVMLTLSFANTQYALELDPSDLRIWYMNEDGDMEPMDDCEVDVENQTVTAPVLHFSRYILG